MSHRRAAALAAATLLFAVLGGAPLFAGPAASATEICPLYVGAEIPDLTLKTGEGESYDLNAAIEGKPSILVFYRGGW